MVYSVKVLKDGYSYEKDGQYKANGTCALILGPDSKELGMYCIGIKTINIIICIRTTSDEDDSGHAVRLGQGSPDLRSGLRGSEAR